ncbi:class C beta-lactamase-related serine hydrolase [Seongchinamella sediminis]|uniref:Class C beta-lactamase-related serine hydrolase n=1 Tax=Seongchinamella sediminis TaxID=2283635 RepID=A0A3L7DZA4_9GAMM|nr:serine hydrolase [Seongchinamella sediminis]RLQ21995.1 class C beta-lactamase-related serine hydrolase [Seongchinamella sediminis]
MRKWLLVSFAVVSLILVGVYLGTDRDTRTLLANLPSDRNVLFWSLPQRDAAFRTMDRLPVLARSRVVAAGSGVSPLAAGEPLVLDLDVDQYMAQQRTAGLVIVQGGAVRLEKYGLGFNAAGRWTSFSVAKSLTSTLVGAAIADGYIDSVDDRVSDYIPGLRGSAYDDVSIRQLLTMTSGVAWNEDYEDRNSDVAQFNEHQAEPGVDVTVSYMRALPRDVPAGAEWVYKTGETNLIGVLVSAASGKQLADYLAEKIWTPYGMEQDASWLLGSTGHEIGGCCLQAATRDFARFGLFMLGGGKVNGQSILPQGWLSAATRKQADIGVPGRGYGYQWWTYDDGSYAAQGIFGQGIFIDPARELVIASNSNWPRARGVDGESEQRQAFYRAVQAAVDRE